MKKIIFSCLLMSFFFTRCSDEIKEDYVYSNNYYDDEKLKDSMIFLNDFLIRKWSYNKWGDLESFYESVNVSDSIEYGVHYGYVNGEKTPRIISRKRFYKKHGVSKIVSKNDSVIIEEYYINGTLVNSK